MATFKITFNSVSLGRRISFSQYIGLKSDYMSLRAFIAACAVISREPEKFPCIQVFVFDSDGITCISSDVVFRAIRYDV